MAPSTPNKNPVYTILDIIFNSLSFSVLVILLLLPNADPYFYTPNRDSGFFLYAGRVILKGGLLYRDVWDSKPPAIFYLNALGLWLGRDTRWGVWLLEFLFLFCSTWIAFLLIKKLWNTTAAVAGTLFWLWAASRVMATGNLIEEYPLLFSFLALYCFYQATQHPRQWVYPFLIGTTAALNFLFRANIIGVPLAILIAFFIDAALLRQFTRFFLRTAAFLVGISLPLLLAALYFYRLGSLAAMLDAALLYNFSYTGQHADFLYSLAKAFAFLGPAAWISLALYIAILIDVLRQWRGKNVLPISILLALLWPLEVGLSTLSGRAYDHYFVSWAPALALMAGSAADLLLRLKGTARVLPRTNQASTWILLGMALLSLVLYRDVFLEYRRAFLDILVDHKTTFEKTSPITDYLHDHTRAEDSILAWGGQAGINYMAHRSAPTAYIWYPLYLDSPLTARLDGGFLDDLQRNQPVLIIDAYQNAPEDVLSINPAVRLEQLASGHSWLLLTNQTPNLQKVYQWIAADYQLETRVDGYDIYRFKGTPQALARSEGMKAH